VKSASHNIDFLSRRRSSCHLAGTPRIIEFHFLTHGAVTSYDYRITQQTT